MLPQAKEIIIQSILSAWERIEWRKNSIGIFGFDLMPDASRKLWLLEVNKCPTMEYSTHVTRALVPRFLEDLADLVLAKKRPQQIKGFECIYKSPKIADEPAKDRNIEVIGTGIVLCSSTKRRK